jgi:hypothetical protein
MLRTQVPANLQLLIMTWPTDGQAMRKWQASRKLDPQTLSFSRDSQLILQRKHFPNSESWTVRFSKDGQLRLTCLWALNWHLYIVKDLKDELDMLKFPPVKPKSQPLIVNSSRDEVVILRPPLMPSTSSRVSLLRDLHHSEILCPKYISSTVTESSHRSLSQSHPATRKLNLPICKFNFKALKDSQL